MSMENKMGFVKIGDAEKILGIVDGKTQDDEEVKIALDDAKEAAKKIGEDGNNSSFNTESK